ncbi:MULTISPECIES: LysR substrate-binding domain-containing protein [Leisingera]|jgi:LysR family glycine cleavage system transcriptional activator|uniref:LysR substrate-binding domain-containing protein n=1 Tax=Leisingera TaxID=191028 RepID=UPI001154B93B|nr:MULTISPECIES: LysR substrate-binding domain-containing protein [Leisingera]QDI77649.1 LysR family transcriptional regulator [Leisingera aquaemixtae]
MRLPNLNALRMFDAAARHLNFGRAAEELHLTQGAVAQQVRRLETDLGHKLFHRHARGLTLTDTGRSYHAPVSQALALIRDATATLAPAVQRVTLSVPPSFASKWLVPRLPEFQARHPDIDLRVVAEESLADFKRDGIDIAVRQGSKPQEGRLNCALLSLVDLVAVASPDLALTKEESLDLPAIAQLTLIQDGHRHWDLLLRQEGLTATGRVLQFNQTALAMDAAVNGQGIALVPRMFLGNQPLDILWQAPRLGDQGFYVLWPSAQGRAKTVVDWLLRQ